MLGKLSQPNSKILQVASSQYEQVWEGKTNPGCYLESLDRIKGTKWEFRWRLIWRKPDQTSEPKSRSGNKNLKDAPAHLIKHRIKRSLEMSKAANTRCETPCKERFLCEFQGSLAQIPCTACWHVELPGNCKHRNSLPGRGGTEKQLRPRARKRALGIFGSPHSPGT